MVIFALSLKSADCKSAGTRLRHNNMMKTLSFLRYFLIFMVLLVSACQTKEPNKKNQIIATELNDKGFGFLNQYFFDCNPSQLDSALKYFQEALAIDKNQSAAKANLKVTLMKKKNYEQLIDIMLTELGTVSPQDHMSKAEVFGFIAMLYNKIGNFDCEKQMCTNASNEYALVLSDGNKSIQPYQLISYLKYKTYIEGKETALTELEQYEGAFSEEDYMTIKEEIDNYEINDLFVTECDDSF